MLDVAVWSVRMTVRTLALIRFSNAHNLDMKVQLFSGERVVRGDQHMALCDVCHKDHDWRALWILRAEAHAFLQRDLGRELISWDRLWRFPGSFAIGLRCGHHSVDDSANTRPTAVARAQG